MRRRDFLAGGLAATAMPSAARAQGAFPSKPIHLIVPTSAGGVHDVIGRIWAERAAAALGNIVVENRAGGGSSIALNYVAQQPADGHTLLVGSTSTLVLREGSNNKAYDALKDIAAISILATTSTSIAVNPSLPVKSVKELIAYLKANPGKLSYGSGGVGAITHITPELFKQQAGGLDMLHVPYRGVGPAMNDLLGGQIQVIFPNITSAVVALHRSGKLRLLSVNAPERLEAAPDIPTSNEEGLKDFVSQIFFGVFAPIKTPMPIREQIDAVTQKEWTRQGIPEEARRLRLRADARLRPRARRPLPARGIRQVESRSCRRCRASDVAAPSLGHPFDEWRFHARRPSPALRCASRTPRCCAAAGALSTTSRCPASCMRASCAARWRMRGSTASMPARRRALPGVRAVLTYRDLRPLIGCDRIPLALPVAAIRHHVDPSWLAEKEMCFVGEPVAVVVAESRAIAEDAANLVALDYDELPAVLDPVAALDARRAAGAARLRRQSRRAMGARIRRRRARLRAAPHIASRSASASTRAAAMRSRRARVLARFDAAEEPAHGLGRHPDAAQGQARHRRDARA